MYSILARAGRPGHVLLVLLIALGFAVGALALGAIGGPLSPIAVAQASDDDGGESRDDGDDDDGR